MTIQQDRPRHGERRDFLKSVALGAAAFGIGAAGPEVLLPSVGGAQAAVGKTLKMAFIQFMPHTVPAAWSKGIEDVLSKQGNIDYQLLDGQAKAEVQISLMDTQINDGANVIFLQPVDSVAIGPSIAKAKRAGIPVITLNIDAVEDHAAHVEMSHYAGAMDIAKTMGAAMGGKGKVAIINAPPGIIIRDQRTNGFVDGLKKYHPEIQIVADQPADWDRKKAQDVFTTIFAAHPDVSGVFGVNDLMALGVVDVAQTKRPARQVGRLRRRRRKGRARVHRSRGAHRDAIHRCVPTGSLRGRDGGRPCDRRRRCVELPRQRPLVDTLHHRHQEHGWPNPTESAVVASSPLRK